MNKAKNKIIKIFTSIIISILILAFMIFGFILYIIIDFEKESSPVVEKNIEQDIESYIINYLNTKYGNNNFNIIEIEKDFSYNGIISSYHTGYNATISSPILTENIILHIPENNSSLINSAEEDFVEKYYNQIADEYLSQKYDLEFDINIKDESIPNDCGHIPTLNELLDFNAIDDIYISVYQSNVYPYDNDINGRLDHLKILSKDLITYFNISKDITYTFTRWAWNDSFRYNVLIKNDNIQIINDSTKETYNFNINDI